MTDDRKRRRRRTTAAILAATTVAATVAASSQLHADATTTTTSFTEVVRYTFDEPARPGFLDLAGGDQPLKPVSSKGGAFTAVSHGDGAALMFPPPCRHEPCPRIALRARNAADLNPGRRPIRFGASVLLAADQTTKGENVVQKGYSAHGSQWKLQIDGKAGKPSCAMVDAKGHVHIARSGITVADNTWHTLECRRKGSSLTIRVDGRRRGGTTIPAGLTVSNGIPLSIGGKGAYRDNDQFQGVLDDVWVAIGGSS
ncbi:LamG-like jellyroll fold domain-containing protein [Actinoplanes sp. NPDC049548]|uniref:LamG-like jellyroll fold domain-containing protein n=1 Tax=Actinoplanes sp. NPDC049548 TaxID=3155152 RepID=UPI00341A0321